MTAYHSDDDDIVYSGSDYEENERETDDEVAMNDAANMDTATSSSEPFGLDKNKDYQVVFTRFWQKKRQFLIL